MTKWKQQNKFNKIKNGSLLNKFPSILRSFGPPKAELMNFNKQNL